MERSNTYKLQNITDLCSSNGIGEVEFRLTEIKSAMRFWWRALNAYENISDMKKDEEKIFGSSSAYKSPIVFYIEKINFKKSDGEYKVKKNMKGIYCFKPGKEAEINMTLYKRKAKNNEIIGGNIEFYDNLLRISLILGGVGKRSRRGCGVFSIVDENIENENISNSIFEAIQNYMKTLDIENNYEFKELTNKYFKISIKEELLKNKDIDYPYIEEILISNKVLNWDDLDKRIKKALYEVKNEKYKEDGKRLACPVYVTCYGKIDQLCPIIVKLHNTGKFDLKSYKEYYDTFKEVIL